MSDLSGSRQDLPIIAKLKRILLTRRALVYAGAALAVLLVLAWFDAGEEPLHPIVQHIASPIAEGAGS